ncbi:MAG: PEGA domain-containing protein [Sandaracinaceae bacterium]|nr:PEGA domain-containing protein [Sandaracinaceae bacterium]
MARTCIALSLWACLATTVHAQRRSPGEPSAAVSDDARQRFVHGVELFDEGDLEAALAEFRRSHELQAVPGVLVNVAVCLTALHRYDEAIEVYRRYLHDATRASPERRLAAEEAIADLERSIATVTLVVDRDGASVSVDGRPVGRSPLARPLRLAAGLRVVEVELEGFVAVREELELAGGVAREVAFRLAPLDRNGVLRAEAVPPEALLRIDGVEVGRGPLERRLSMGGHVVEASLTGFRTWHSDVSLADGQELSLRIQLERDEGDATREWWFWTIVGVGGLGVVGAVVAGVLCGATDACTTEIVVPGNQGVLRL